MLDEKASKILICDDIAENRKLLASTIQRYTQYEIVITSEGHNVVEMAEQILPDVILLDIMMPGMDGFEVNKQLKENPATAHIPIIFITALGDTDSKVKAFENGGADYISKPFSPKEVIVRIKNQIRLSQLMNHLEETVKQRTQELESLNYALVLALENANYYNDTETGGHIHRVKYYSSILAKSMNLPDRDVEVISRYAPLHDIGKVGIPHTILKKEAKLTLEEFAKIKEHSYIGYKIIDLPGIPSAAKNIVYYHHEKWDGSGYPGGLKGESIPIEARIVALADVYDALRSERPYKKPYSEEESVKIIEDSSGTHFDPAIIQAFLDNRAKFNEIFNSLSQLEALSKE
ncbi:MAG: hypothetical protein A2Y33_07305 [Spirochaetes bacterium GWF1_51_8]|nr:MAG: hypothetical protein A2Y33_07305 [Spirochaetes bacterium GWF1_51_8]